MEDNKNKNELALWVIILLIVVVISILGTMFLNSIKKDDTQLNNEQQNDISKYLGNKTVDEIEAQIDKDMETMEDESGVD